MPQHTVTAAILSFLHDTPTLLREFLCPQVKLLDNFNTSQHAWSLDAQDLEISNLGRHMATSGQAGTQNQQYLRGTVKGYCKNQRSCSHLHLRERPVSPSPLSKAPAAPAYTQNYQALLSTYYHYNNMLITQAVQPQWMLVARDNKA